MCVYVDACMKILKCQCVIIPVCCFSILVTLYICFSKRGIRCVLYDMYLMIMSR